MYLVRVKVHIAELPSLQPVNQIDLLISQFYVPTSFLIMNSSPVKRLEEISGHHQHLSTAPGMSPAMEGSLQSRRQEIHLPGAWMSGSCR